MACGMGGPIWLVSRAASSREFACWMMKTMELRDKQEAGHAGTQAHRHVP